MSAKMKTETFILQLPKRTVALTVTEHDDRIEFGLKFSAVGSNFCDTPQLQKWLHSIFEKYDSDPRPSIMVHPGTGEKVTLWGDAKHCVGIYQPPKV